MNGEVDMLITVHFGVFWAVSMVVLCAAFMAGMFIGQDMRK